MSHEFIQPSVQVENYDDYNGYLPRLFPTNKQSQTYTATCSLKQIYMFGSTHRWKAVNKTPPAPGYLVL
ncbi:hypothetical protein ACU8KH_06654 [Lachancea thermotolerans]